MTNYPQFQCLVNSADVQASVYGARAERLAKLALIKLPVPLAFGISMEAVHDIAAGQMVDVKSLLAEFGTRGVVSVRSSPVERGWGGPETLLNVGMNDDIHKKLCSRLGVEPATAIYARFVQEYSIHVARLDVESFEQREFADAESRLAGFKAVFEEEMDEAFPQDPAVQLNQVLRSMARAWEGTSARILRQAKGAPADAGLGLVVQRMALGLGAGECGAGSVQFVNVTSGATGVFGRYMPQGQGRDADKDKSHADFIAIDERGSSLEEAMPQALSNLRTYAETARMECKDALNFEFTVESGELWLLDAAPARRSRRAAVRIAVDLAEEGVITKKQALLRIEPRSLSRLLHPQIDAETPRDIFASGLAASPGAATGAVVFSATAAQAFAAREEACILVRHETSPEDIRGMHSASGVLTERGGMTSHAAVIARGLGVPCVVGATGIGLNIKEKTLTTKTGLVLKEGDIITIDGTAGDAITGSVEMVQPELDGAFSVLMSWAEDACDIAIRTNADTAVDARLARSFKVDGIGLCRTEHMFFNEDRLTVMREMIFADTQEDRRAALARLLPMQRGDFIELFDIMRGLPVCIRLFDLPLHEFLPHSRDEMQELAEAMDLPVSHVIARADELAEFNPMLGMRGVRLGIAFPEIYEMQARAIFEAAAHSTKMGSVVVPEVMIPLVSAHREVEVVKTSVDQIARSVQVETGVSFAYRLGVMVETPRAALRSGDLAASSAFLSFGTNDLTQMTYGLSRDDAGRFMREYVNLDVYHEDPFHTLDVDGVGELLLMAAERGRRENPDIVLSVCGEHGGDPASIAFCREVGFDYVSCSPYRIPIARLAAAQCAILAGKTDKQVQKTL